MLAKYNRPFTAFLLGLVSLLAIIVRGDTPAQLGVNGSLKLPPAAILNEASVPLLAASGRVGFVTIVTDGSLVSFNTRTGALISSVVVGHGAGIPSMVEAAGKRLIAVPTSNSPEQNLPATISVIDATKPSRMLPISLIVLPAEAHLTSSSRALLTSDGRFVMAASYYPNPKLYSFDVESGAEVSEVALHGLPSRIALYGSSPGTGGEVAVVSADSNSLSLFTIDPAGNLTASGAFSPSNGAFGEWNNPVFGSGGKVVYVAAATGSELYSVDASNGNLFDSVQLSSTPQQISINSSPESDTLAVTRTRQSDAEGLAGVSVFTGVAGRVALKSEFTPENPAKFAKSNNVAFSSDGLTGFAGSASGSLFAFDIDTGQQQSSVDLGGELMGVSVNATEKSAAVIRRATNGDEIVVVAFAESNPASDSSQDATNNAPVVDNAATTAVNKDSAKKEAKEAKKHHGKDKSAPPVISGITPGTVELGQTKNVKIKITGAHFGVHSSVTYGDGSTANTVRISSNKLEARLPQSAFTQIGDISIQVKEGHDRVSNIFPLHVTAASAIMITTLNPSDVPGPHAAFELKVRGSGFKHTSVININSEPLKTNFVSKSLLTTRVPGRLTQTVQDLTVQVTDSSSAGSSNSVTLSIFGPKITQISTSRTAVVAGQPGFKISIHGHNFREGAKLQVNGTALAIAHRSPGLIRSFVSSKFIQQAGTLSFVVQNADGASSAASNVNVLPPSITSFNPTDVIAGLPDVKLAILGSNFRNHLLVTIIGSDGTPKTVPDKLVKFASSSRIIVTLSKHFNQLIAQPGTLNVQVTNPNRSTGVPSAAVQLQVLAPSVTSVSIESGTPDSTHSRVVIHGKDFVQGATVQFVKDGSVLVQRTPDSFGPEKLIVILSSNKITGLGQFTVRVVNPGGINSNEASPQ